MKTVKHDNFLPLPAGNIHRRSGIKKIPYKRTGFITRIVNWWNGNPSSVNSMVTYDGILCVATDKGLYYYDGSKLARVEYLHQPKESE